MPIRIVSYNIHKGFKAGGRTLILDPLKEAILRLDPDVLLLQEIIGEHALHSARFPNWPGLPQHEFFKSDTLQHVSYGKNVVYPHGHHGNAVLSKIPIVYESNVDVTVFKPAPRGLLHTVLESPDQRLKIHALSVHLGLLERERQMQMRAVAAYIQNSIPATAPLILAGDFNDWRERAAPLLEMQLGMKEAFKEFYGTHSRTFPSWLPMGRLDRIYFRNLQLESCQRPSGLPWSRLSDHLPLVAEFS